MRSVYHLRQPLDFTKVHSCVRTWASGCVPWQDNGCGWPCFFYGVKVMTRRLRSLWWRSHASITWRLRSSFKCWRRISDLQAELSKIIAAVAMRSGEGEARVAAARLHSGSTAGGRTAVHWFRINWINVFKLFFFLELIYTILVLTRTGKKRFVHWFDSNYGRAAAHLNLTGLSDLESSRNLTN